MTLVPVLILDASLLINFLKVDRAEIIKAYPAKILITEHVRDEVTSAYPEQLERLNHAIAENIVEILVINDLSEIDEIVNFREEKTQRQLGIGECSAIIMASKRNCSIGIDDGPAIKVIRKEFPSLSIVQTTDLVVEAVRRDVINIEEADTLKEVWATQHRFKLKIKSFSELL